MLLHINNKPVKSSFTPNLFINPRYFPFGNKMVELEPDKCMLCGGCVAVCPTDCITVYEAFMDIDQNDCTNCGSCVTVCPVGAMAVINVKA